ncbi:Holliday junction DNA helicase RuvB C-terminal domain-containing protein [Spiroplasma endosymbiont of Atherix ibis]|uniref:Holliday junction DNA helicase RuvB C-terminal domain-containing protein n=1 Tax=Spiroplasma endosymbiont of Atherix ibis TaxID=3066291 RepID=UPI0030CCFD30
MEIYDSGLNYQEVSYLKLLNNYNYLGIETIQQILGLQQQIIIKNIEPLLIRNFLIEKTNKGREWLKQNL